MIAISRDAAPHPEPRGLLDGPMVALINEFSASDGDIFSYRFRKYKLGKLIGKRTWGGLVGIPGTPVITFFDVHNFLPGRSMRA